MFELSCGQLGLVIAGFVFGVATVTRHPAADDRLMDLHQGIKALPQIAIFQIPFVPARPGSPALGLPLRQPAGNPLDDVLAVADDPDVAGDGDLLQPVDDRHKLGPIVGGPSNCPGAAEWLP